MLANFLNGKDGKNLSDKHLRDLVLNMTIAGRDTTACTLSWMVYILTQNQDVQAQLCKEIDEKLQGRTPTLEDLNPKNMPYLNGVLYETLRLYPPVPEDEKVVTEDGLVYPDGTPVYKGTHLIFSPYSMGRNPKVYPDPLKVVPTRWIPFKTPDPYAFPVFQAGPRFCLGKDMAQFEAKVSIKFSCNAQAEGSTVSLVPDCEASAEVYVHAAPWRSREDHILAHDNAKRLQFEEARLTQSMGRATSPLVALQPELRKVIVIYK